jgi:hypothetical protein
MQNQVARENELALLCSGVVGGRIVGVLVAKLRPENKRGSNPVAPSNQVRGSDRSREASSSGSCAFFLCARPVDPVGFFQAAEKSTGTILRADYRTRVSGGIWSRTALWRIRLAQHSSTLK